MPKKQIKRKQKQPTTGDGMEMVWDWKSIGSLLATVVFLRSAIREYLPAEIRRFLASLFRRMYASFRPTCTIIIDEIEASGNGPNDLFDAAQSYLSSRCLSSAPVLSLSKPRHSRAITSSLPSAYSTADSFGGFEVKWVYRSVDQPSSSRAGLYGRSSSSGGSSERRCFELCFHRRHRGDVHSRYIPHVLQEANRLKLKARERRLYTNRSIGSSSSSGDDYYGSRLWSSVPFNHPSTFQSLAIEPALRDSIRSDLLRFSSRRDYYTRVGRAWKRGYLLHGPPGTGKTSLIAAIANFLEFDIYDLELTAVSSNSHLRKLLISTSAKSIVVVEDVDCSLDLSDRIKKPKPMTKPNPNSIVKKPNPDSTVKKPKSNPDSTVSLSGVLNFVDGLWSSCVGERLMIFTTNCPDNLDPALLRPGRMDRRIHLSYCGTEAFRMLARNYLELVDGHEMMGEAEALLKEVNITPADIAEVFMGCEQDGADVGMKRVVEELKRRKTEEEEEAAAAAAA